MCESILDDTVLRAFADTSPSGILISPFSRDGVACASDTFAICCRPCSLGEPDDFSGAFQSPKVVGMVESYARMAGPLAALAHPLRYAECSACGGRGMEAERVACSSCAGSGACSCDACGDSHDCRRCDGTGYANNPGKCPACQGCGIVRNGIGVDVAVVGGVTIRPRHALALMRLPGVVEVADGEDYGREFLIFRAGEYFGVILGTR